jgi:hypothetical protein
VRVCDRSRRYGKDRLYVTAGAVGSAVGRLTGRTVAHGAAGVGGTSSRPTTRMARSDAPSEPETVTVTAPVEG